MATMNRLATVQEVASFLGTSTDYVYRNAEALGALRLPTAGDSALKHTRDSRATLSPTRNQKVAGKQRLRFDLEDVKRRITCQQGRQSEPWENGLVEPKPRSRRRRGLGTNVDLLPIRGDK
jgi:hypothetical protein